MFLLAMNGWLRICKETDMQCSVAKNADTLTFLTRSVPCSFTTTLDADPVSRGLCNTRCSVVCKSAW